MDDRTQPGRHRWFEVFQVDNGEFRPVKGDSSWRVKNLKECLQRLILQQLEARGLRRQQFPTLVFFSADGGVLYDGDVVADYCSGGKDDRPGQRIVMFNMTACVDPDQRGPSIPDPNANGLGLVHACDDMRQDLGDQLKGLHIAERSLGDKLVKDVNTVKQAIGLLTGELDGQDFSILRCGSSLEQLFSQCPVVHRGGERLFREQGEAPLLIDCLAGGRNAIDFGKFDDMQNRRDHLLDSLRGLQDELREIELKTRENEGSVSVRQDIHDLLYDPEPKADLATFDVLVDAKTKMCGVVLARLELISQNQKRLRKCMYKQNSQGDIAQRVNHIKSTCRDLSTLSRMPTAYVSALHEIRRQRKFSEQYRRNVDELRTKIESMRDQEIERRRDFVGRYGKYLPTDWNEFDGLRKKPVDYFRYMPHSLDEPSDTAPLPEVSEEGVVEAAEAVDPVFAANPTLKGATGWGEAMADHGNLDFYEPATEDQVRLLQKLLLALHAEVGAAKSDRDTALAARDRDASDRNALLDGLRASFAQVADALPQAHALDATDPANWPALISQLELAVAEQNNDVLVGQLQQTIADQARELEVQRNAVLMRDQDSRERDEDRDEFVEMLRIAFEALSDVAMPEDLLPANASLSDPSGWPAVVGQLGRLIAVQRRQFEQLTQQLAAASARMSSSSYGDGDGAVSGYVTSSVAASIGAEPGPVVPSPLVSTTGFTVGSVAFFVPWTSQRNGGKKGFIAFQSPSGRIRYALDAECVATLGLGLNTPFVGRITDISSAAESCDRAVVKAELIAGPGAVPAAGTSPARESSA